MFKFILAFFVIMIWMTTVYRRKKSFILPSVFVLGLYFISVLLSYPHVIVNEELLSLDPKYFEASIVFLSLLLLYLLPFTNIREDKVKSIVLPNAKTLYVFSVAIIFLSLFSIIFFTPTVIDVFSVENLGDARILMTQEGPFVEVSIWNTIASVSASLYTIALILFFIYRAKGTNKKMSILLLASSFSYVFNVFAYVGRDGVVFWIFSFIGTYWLFRNYISSKDKKTIRKYFNIFLIIAIPLFMAITFDRFSDNPLAGIISYMGQSFPNFTLAYHADYPVSGGNSFPLFKEILGLPMTESYSGEFGGTVTWVFGTFLKSFLLNFDIIGTIILGLGMGLILKLTFRKNSSVFYFHQLFIYFLYFQIFSQGVFYFRQYGRGGNLFIVLSFFFYFVFLFLKRHENNPVVLKINND